MAKRGIAGRNKSGHRQPDRSEGKKRDHEPEKKTKTVKTLEKEMKEAKDWDDDAFKNIVEKYGI